MHTLFLGGRHDHILLSYIYTQLLEVCLNGHNLVSFEATMSRFFMVIDLNDTYRMMIPLMMMIDLNDIYRMMMIMLLMIIVMMMLMMMKTQNSHNSAPV